jgi:hypothetical protein
MAKKNRPPKALRDGLVKLFKQHDWPEGRPAALVPNNATETAINCPPGSSPHDITYQDANGNWVTKTVCV